jgi:class 3 adenylate cyclase
VVLDNETQDVIAEEIEEFITGERHHFSEPDRVLATVMFTDIVRSTELAADHGDARWRELLASHYTVLRKELATFQGHEIKTGVTACWRPSMDRRVPYDALERSTAS